MATSVLESITQNMLDTLTSVAQVNGYDNTLVTKQISPGEGDSSQDSVVWLTMGTAQEVEAPTQRQQWDQQFIIVCSLQQDETLALPTMDTRINSIEADIGLAMLQDYTRGGWAFDTRILPRDSAGYDTGSKSAVVAANIVVRYRHKYGNPYLVS